MKVLDYEERKRALEAIETLYWLELIDESTCLMLKDKVSQRTGA